MSPAYNKISPTPPPPPPPRTHLIWGNPHPQFVIRNQYLWLNEPIWYIGASTLCILKSQNFPQPRKYSQNPPKFNFVNPFFSQKKGLIFGMPPK